MLDYGFALKRVKMLRICTLRYCLAMTQGKPPRHCENRNAIRGNL
ncbi:hypothetical protein [Helicobacter rodentium]|nr:hypothetical protein [Helicobacter rodentium]